MIEGSQRVVCRETSSGGRRSGVSARTCGSLLERESRRSGAHSAGFPRSSARLPWRNLLCWFPGSVASEEALASIKMYEGLNYCSQISMVGSLVYQRISCLYVGCELYFTHVIGSKNARIYLFFCKLN